MGVPMLDLHAEYLTMKEEIDAAIQRVISSGTFVMGPELEAFEKRFASYIGVKHAIGVGSGTASLHLALLASELKPGDEVITVPNTDLPTTMTISHCGGCEDRLPILAKSMGLCLVSSRYTCSSQPVQSRTSPSPIPSSRSRQSVPSMTAWQVGQ